MTRSTSAAWKAAPTGRAAHGKRGLTRLIPVLHRPASTGGRAAGVLLVSALLVSVSILAAFPGAGRAADAPPAPAPADAPPKQLFRGKVVKVADALKGRGIKAYADELKNQVALETATGELIPILPDWRGRAFVQDERLRNRDVELVGFRRPGLPYLSVLSVYTFDEQGHRQYTDYWCDICSIPMYEIKPCDCCQQEIRLRFQRQEITELDAGQAPKGSKPESPPLPRD